MLKRLLSVPMILLFSIAATSNASAQCTIATVNWDNLDYLQRNAANYATYITAGLFPTMVQDQSFAIGTNRVTIETDYTSANILGENGTHTGHPNSFAGAGDDVAFNGNGTITLRFDTAVSNVRFSIFDLDNAQVATVTAFEGVTARPVTLTKPAASTVAIVGNAGTGVGGIANNSSQATLNVAVTGPVTSITIVFSGTAGEFWLSDIEACVYRNFSTNYYAVAQPYIGQPAYVLAVHDRNTIYMVDSSGRAVSLFTDNSLRVPEINNIAYDPYNHDLYYSIDGIERANSYGMGPNGNPDTVRYIRRYDFDTETFSEIMPNINNAPFNIPTFSSGLETGGAAFYDGSLYVGVEGKNTSSNSGREAIIWRIDFNSSQVPIKASQVFAMPGDNGSGTSTHDWGDIIIKDGILYDFNSLGSSAGTLGQYNLVNLQTNAITNQYTGIIPSNKPRQVAQQWNGNFFWLHDSIGRYNGTNVITGKQRIVATPRSVPWIAGAGDATEAFRPKADFGDAPASYDPIALSPALHERDTAMFLGTATFNSDWDWEWNKQTSANATGDGADEDGLAYVPLMNPGGGGYVAQVSVYNHTGANGRVIAWLDINGNGTFEAGEANSTVITVPSSTNKQLFWLYWPNTTNTFMIGQSTFLRIRLTTAANGMTTANPTGFFLDGEVEDYRVMIDNYPLSVNLLTFDAKAINKTTARLVWRTTGEENFYGFQVERSADGTNWTELGFVNANGRSRSELNDYTYNDLQALTGKSYYRLKLKNAGGQSTYSEVRMIIIKDLDEQLTIMPNPARSNATVYITSTVNENATVILTDMNGKELRKHNYRLNYGGNTIPLDNLDRFAEGTYIVRLVTTQGIISRKLIINRN